jgi:molybdopterin-guanine dinucleotide biosynthesis protein B
VLIGSSARFALIHELRGEVEPSLGDLLRKLSPVDLVLIEGYKREPHPKLEVYRAAVGKPLIQPSDPAVVAIASDSPLADVAVPVVDLDDVERIADIVLEGSAPLDEVLGRLERN